LIFPSSSHDMNANAPNVNAKTLKNSLFIIINLVKYWFFMRLYGPKVSNITLRYTPKCLEM